MEIEQSFEAPKDRRTDALGDLRVLPDETLCAILVLLCPRDVARLSCVSRSISSYTINSRQSTNYYFL